MGNNVVPRQQGDAYQCRFFWFQAGKLFQPQTNAVRIEWESSSTAGFDDVVLHYSPEILDDGEKVTVENFQVKYHVDHRKDITSDAFIDPSFIGTTDDTILKRLYRYYKQSPEIYKTSRFIFVNTWQLDTNGFGKYVGNGGGIVIKSLFDGTTDFSSAGRIRKSWRDHLGITSDEELLAVVKPLRIWDSFHDLNGILEPLNDRLQLAGFKPIRADQRSTVYHDLIQRLHAEGKKVFTKEELIEICRQEDLLAPKGEVGPPIHSIGIRSFRKGAETLELEVKDLVCMLHHFSGRYLLEALTWNEVYPEISDLATRAVAAKKPLHVHLDTHLSIAFCLGYCLDFKYGVQVSIIQKTMSGRVVWAPEPEKLIDGHDAWDWTETVLNEAGKDLVLVLSVTHDIAANVEAFTNSHIREARKIIYGSIRPKPSSSSIRDANHIISAVQETVKQVRATITKMAPDAVVHLFMAAPNAFAFFLGQQSHSLGRLMLYEYDFERYRTGDYGVSVSLPIL